MNRAPLDTSSQRDFGMAPAKQADIQTVREQMTRMFGNAKLPAVVYKGETIEARQL